jgi:hypothetical protein
MKETLTIDQFFEKVNSNHKMELNCNSNSHHNLIQLEEATQLNNNLNIENEKDNLTILNISDDNSPKREDLLPIPEEEKEELSLEKLVAKQLSILNAKRDSFK